VLGLTVTVVALTAFGRRGNDNEKNPAVLPLGVITFVFAALSLVWTIRTGHAGASSVWGGF